MSLSAPNSSPESATDYATVTRFLDAGRSWSAYSSRGHPNALTCDVEDYFQVSAFEHLISRESWASFECRISRNVEKILEAYDEAEAKGTFFILSWVAENYPHIVKKIAAHGHEVSSHGRCHARVFNMSEREFRIEASESRKLLQDTSGQPVIGYRAASWSFDRRTPWAHSILAECGYTYSSSIYPVAHDHYGVPDAPTTPFYLRAGGILEIPASTARIFGRNWPAAGGGYFRLLPYGVSRWLFAKSRKEIGVPSVFYFHPWELDPQQPRIHGISVKTRFRHYVNLSKFENRLARILRDFSWERMDKIYFGEAP